MGDKATETDRQKYLNGDLTHEEYYRMIYKETGISMDHWERLNECRKALANGDEHLNNIPISVWDGLSLGSLHLPAVFERHGDCFSISGGVCAFKQAVKDALEAHPMTKTKHTPKKWREILDWGISGNHGINDSVEEGIRRIQADACAEPEARNSVYLDALERIAHHPHNVYGNTESVDVTDGHRCAAKIAKAALQNVRGITKHPKIKEMYEMLREVFDNLPRWVSSGMQVGPSGRDHDFGTRLANLLTKAEKGEPNDRDETHLSTLLPRSPRKQRHSALP